MNILTSKALRVVTLTLLLGIMVFVSADTASAQFKSGRLNPNLHNFHMKDFGQPGYYNDCFGGCGRNLYDNSSLFDNGSLLDSIDIDPMSTILRLAPRDKSNPYALKPHQLYNWRMEKYENCMERMAREQSHLSWSQRNAACAHHKLFPRK